MIFALLPAVVIAIVYTIHCLIVCLVQEKEPLELKIFFLDYVDSLHIIWHHKKIHPTLTLITFSILRYRKSHALPKLILKVEKIYPEKNTDFEKQKDTKKKKEKTEQTIALANPIE